MAVYDDDKLLSQFDEAPAINDVDRIVLGDGDDPNKVLYVTVADLKTHIQRGIDDSPVDSQTIESISSNWAYDHAATYTTHAANVTTLHLPSQADKSGYFLTTDASVASWTNILDSVKITNIVAGSTIAIQGWQIDFYFYASDHNTVNWTVGTLKLADSTTFNITSGNTGNISAITYIYFDYDASETVLQTSTTASDSVGLNKILIAVANDVASGKKARIQMFGGYDNITTELFTADTIAADTITANEIAGNTITASEIYGGTITSTEIAASTITTSELNFVPVQDTDVIASINASSEGIRIEADNIEISGTTTFSAGYNPTNAVGTFTSTTVSNQKIVIDGSDATIKFYDTNENIVILMDDLSGGYLRVGEYTGADGEDWVDLEQGAISIYSDLLSTQLSLHYWKPAAPGFTKLTQFKVGSYGNTTIGSSSQASTLTLEGDLIGKYITTEKWRIARTTGNITTVGTVDGVDISAHASDTDAHHAQSHTHDSHTGTLSVSEGGTGATSFTTSRVVVSGPSTPLLQASTITTTELGYLNNVSSNIQTQLNGKATTSYVSSAISSHSSNSSAHHAQYSPSGYTGYVLGSQGFYCSSGLVSSVV